MVASRLSTLAILVFLLAAPLAQANDGSRVLPGNKFPIESSDYFLTGASATVANQTGGLELAATSPAAQGTYNFLAPGVSALGLVNTANLQSWYRSQGQDKDREVVEDVVAHLYFNANAQAQTVFEARLYDVSPTGKANLVDSDVQQFITILDPQAIEFPLHIAGVHLLQGHILRLELYAQSGNAAIQLQYGGSTPSGIDSVKTRWLDSDGDGVSDSDEMASGTNPLDPTDQRAFGGQDTDGDGLSDVFEKSIGTNPTKVDTDSDGYGDGLEIHAGSNPLNANSKPYDANHNGLPDVFENRYFNSTTVNQPGGVDPLADPDGDGCNNLCEAAHGTNPNNPDTDGDGVLDGAEVNQGSSPMSPTAFLRGVSGIPEPVAAAFAFAIGSTLGLISLLRRP